MSSLLNILSNIILEQKRTKLEPEITALIRRVTDIIIKKRLSGFDSYTTITSIPIVVADGTPGTVEIAVDPKMKYFGLLDQKVADSKNPNDFIITINPNKISSKKNLYLTLYHEIMHATDPNFSTKSTEKYWEDYDPEIDEKYFGHPIEFRAMSNEFIEALFKEFEIRKKRIRNKNNLNLLIKSADNILSYFSKGENLSKLSNSILDDMSGQLPDDNKIKRVLSNIFVDFPEISDFVEQNQSKTYYIAYVELIKKYNTSLWKRFLSMLYSAIQEIKENIKVD